MILKDHSEVESESDRSQDDKILTKVVVQM
jgi:hypothetical protein